MVYIFYIIGIVKELQYHRGTLTSIKKIKSWTIVTSHTPSHMFFNFKNTFLINTPNLQLFLIF